MNPTPTSCLANAMPAIEFALPHPLAPAPDSFGRKFQSQVLTVLLCLSLFALSSCGASEVPDASEDVGALIPISFELEKPATVTLVIDDATGKRVRNLINAEPFPAGRHTVGWDGLNEGLDALVRRTHGIYENSPSLVDPGDYTVRVLTHDGLDARYEFTVYPNTGNPPWRSEELSGGWLADHAAPSATLFIPAEIAPGGEDQVLIVSSTAEAGHGLVWVNLDGAKRAGVVHFGGSWTGATHLARDRGPEAHKDVYAYTGSTWRSIKDRDKGEIRLMALTTNPEDAPLADIRGDSEEDRIHQRVRQIYRLQVDAEKNPWGRPDPTLHGLAVFNNILLAVHSDTDEILVLRVPDQASRERNENTGEILGRIPAQGTKDLAFDLEGHVLAIIDEEVRRFTLELTPTPSLKNGETIIDSGLDAPRRINVTDDGRMLVSTAGAANQVRVYSPQGEWIMTAGQPGEVTTGEYHPLQMNDPAGTTMDSRGHLWVAEENHGPKRISVWSPEGELTYSFLGPTRYGGGGFLDPRDREVMYLRSGGTVLKFQLDWETGESEVVAVPLRSGRDGPPMYSRVEQPEMVFYSGDHRFITNSFANSPDGGGKIITLWREDENQTFQPLAAMGSAKDWELLRTEEFLEAIPEGVILDRADHQTGAPFTVNAIFAWSDLNGDGIPSPDEITYYPLNELEGNRIAFRVAPSIDENLDVSVLVRGAIVKLSPVSGVEEGRPVYDASKGQLVQNDQEFPLTRELLPAAGGTNVVLGSPIIGYNAEGEGRWAYQNRWLGIHAGHRAPREPEYPGQIIATTRFLGWPQDLPDSKDGQIFAINSDRAVKYFFTTDGFFLGTVGKMGREATPWRVPSLERNASVMDFNFIGENFWPNFTRTSDGKYYLIGGKDHSSIVRLDGVDRIRRHPPHTVSVESGDLQRIVAHMAESAVQESAGGTLSVSIHPDRREPDADESKWSDAEWVTIEERALFRGRDQFSPWSEAAARVYGDRLHIALRTLDRNLLDNEVENRPLVFATGGGLDILLGTDPAAEADRQETVPGDIRIVVARDQDGKPIAMLYEPTSPGAGESLAEAFSSPWRTVRFDRVEEISEEVELATSRGTVEIVHPQNPNAKLERQREVWEVAIPLDLLGLEPQAGLSLRGDVGTLFGTGGETLQRNYWSNRAGGLVNDIPGEASLHPGAWGTWEFVAPDSQ